jgi:hypothetical protein
MENKFTTLNLDEVVHVTDNANPLRQLAQNETFKVQLLVQRIERNFAKQLLDGAECEVMKLDQPGWQKGKIRIKQIEFEFCPESDEDSMEENSPLDEFRNSEV